MFRKPVLYLMWPHAQIRMPLSHTITTKQASFSRLLDVSKKLHLSYRMHPTLFTFPQDIIVTGYGLAVRFPAGDLGLLFFFFFLSNVSRTVLCCIVAKLGLSLWRRNIDGGFLRTECWGEYLDLKGRKTDRGENCIMMNLTACILHRILLGW